MNAIIFILYIGLLLQNYYQLFIYLVFDQSGIIFSLEILFDINFFYKIQKGFYIKYLDVTIHTYKLIRIINYSLNLR